jgi:ankyrin repeat protein
MSIRPLRVKELAEFFAILPDAESIPGLNIGWRPEDPEQFILSACSTLVTVVEDDDDDDNGKTVQFSHFSVKEYLASDRIAKSAPVSCFHILPKPAHRLLAKACLSVLLQLDHKTNFRNFPLVLYAAEHWVNHARFEDVSSYIQDAMDCLFDRNKPHLAAWIRLYDVENNWRPHNSFFCHHSAQLDVVPLYYAALCGFRDLAERLLDAHPQDVNARGGFHETPLLAALDEGHIDIALFLLDRDADPYVEPRGETGHSALYVASSRGYVEVLQSLIDRGADLNAECRGQLGLDTKWRPLLEATKNGRLEIARVLLKHGADMNHQDIKGNTPLSMALRLPNLDLAQFFLDHGANVNTLDMFGRTLLFNVSMEGLTSAVTLLLEYVMDVDPRSKRGWTPLHFAAAHGHLEVVRVLLDCGADVNAQTASRWTALHRAAYSGYLRVVKVLLKHGADPDAKNNEGQTALELAREAKRTNTIHLLSRRTGKMLEINRTPRIIPGPAESYNPADLWTYD